MEIVRIENLSFTYPESKNKALHDINLTVQSGEFILICGESGCGKTTLLKMLKKQLIPKGKISGNIILFGSSIFESDEYKSIKNFGFVMQEPEKQIICEHVTEELAFNLESLGFKKNVIHKKIAEISSYMGIEQLFEKKTSQLSGGEMQKINIASALMCSPKLLILDEPTSQLDPIASQSLISLVKRLNSDLGITVIISEHRTEDLFDYADRVIYMKSGRITANDTPSKTALSFNKENIPPSFPAAVQLYCRLWNTDIDNCPLNNRSGRDFLQKLITPDTNNRYEPSSKDIKDKETVLEIKDLYCKYDRYSDDILKDLSLTLYRSEVYALFGGNGAGKTTLLKAVSGLIKPYSGSIKILGKNIKKYKNNELYNGVLTALPQNVSYAFEHDKFIDEFDNDEHTQELFKSFIEANLITQDLLERNPLDFSGGEKQKAAICIALCTSPKILLLDEPTKGLDGKAKKDLAQMIRTVSQKGVTVFIVTHDTEFSSECADRCGLLFNGRIVISEDMHTFFSENDYYTTAAAKLANGYADGCVTVNELTEFCKGGL